MIRAGDVRTEDLQIALGVDKNRTQSQRARVAIDREIGRIVSSSRNADEKRRKKKKCESHARLSRSCLILFESRLY